MEKTLWLMAGIPGSGKTTFAKNTLIKDNSWLYVSRDEIRFAFLQDGEEYFNKERAVFNSFIDKINNGLHDNIHKNIIADATHLNWASRKKLLNHLSLDTTKVNVVFMKTNYLVCLERNFQREGRARVPAQTIRNMSNHFEHPSKDPFKYNKIYEVNSNRMEEYN